MTFCLGFAIGGVLGACAMMWLMNDLMSGWIDRWSDANLRADKMHRRAQQAEGELQRIRNITSRVSP